MPIYHLHYIMISNQRKIIQPPHSLRKKPSGPVSVPFPPKQNDHYLINISKKVRKLRDRKATYSLCSIESKPSLSPVADFRQFRRRKMQSMASLDARTLETERPIEAKCLDIKRSCPIKKVKQIRTYGQSNEALEEQDSFCFSPKKVKPNQFVHLTKGVLNNIQNNRVELSPFCPREAKGTEIKTAEKPQPATIEYYIKNHSRTHANKPLLVRRGKSNSIINVLSQGQYNDQQDKVCRLQGPRPLASQLAPQTRMQDDAQVQTTKFKIIGQGLGEGAQNTMISIQCSPIGKVNQSSFISGAGKQSLIREFGEQEEFCLGRELEKGRRALKLSNKKIQQVFPSGFFERRI